MDGTGMVEGGVAATRTFPTEMGALAGARTFVVESLEPHVGPARRPEVELVASELITNAIIHGDGPTLDVTVHVNSDHTAVDVTSTSTTDTVGPPEHWEAPVDPLAPSGRGLFLVASMSDTVDVTRHGRVLTITARFDLTSGARHQM